MTHDPTPTDPPPGRAAVATADEPVRIPSWMREPEVEHELTRPERLRLRWGRYGGTLLGAVGVLLVLVLAGGLALGGFRSFSGRTTVRRCSPVGTARRRPHPGRPTTAATV
ncbi:hypothetical protein [Micromonospora wenchangensis]|uniref:hypothetical protein n=1 Tax=Micromonospora wenchangensis TaxID=1185415 RepID=UPI0038146939